MSVTMEAPTLRALKNIKKSGVFSLTLKFCPCYTGGMMEFLDSLSPVVTVLSLLIGFGILLTAQISLFLAIVIGQTRPLREELKEVKLALSNHITDTNRKIDVLKDEVSGLKTDVSGLKTDVSDLKTGQKALETGQKALEADVSDLKTGQKALETGQKALETGQKALETGQKEINGKLDQLLRQKA